MTRFAVDLDGTLAMAVEATLDDLNAEWGTHYTVNDVFTWHYWNSFKELQYLPEPKRREFILRRMDKVWNEGKVQAYPEAASFMRELRKYGRVDIVTGRSGGTTDAALESFFARNGIPYDGIQRTTGSGKVKAMYGYDVYVDDDPSLAAEIAERWPQKQMMLVDRPWNKQVPDSANVRRVFNLHEAIPAGGPQQARLFRRADRQVFVRSHGRKVGVYPGGKYYRERKMEPSECQPGSMRTVDIGREGGHKAVVCRPRGSRKTRTQSILHPRTERERRKLGLPKRVRRSR